MAAWQQSRASALEISQSEMDALFVEGFAGMKLASPMMLREKNGRWNQWFSEAQMSVRIFKLKRSSAQALYKDPTVSYLFGGVFPIQLLSKVLLQVGINM